VRLVQGQGAQPCGIEAFRACTARYYLDGADILPYLSYWQPRQEELELLGCIARTQSHELQPILIEHEMDSRGALAPVLVHLPGVGFARMTAWTSSAMVRSRSGSGHHTEIDQVMRKGAKMSCETRNGPRAPVPVRSAREPQLELIARPGIASQDDKFREGGIRQLGVVGKEERGAPWPM